MIKFIDIDSKIVYDGSRPYVFWMDKEQSVNVIYVKKICVLTDQYSLTVGISSNSVFRLLDMERLDGLVDIDVNDFKYKNIQQLYTNSLTSHGVSYGDYFVHMLYIAAQSDSVGEVHENFSINDDTYEIAADFYAENEVLKINLTNFGVEIPESIQTAVYDENVHEESKDDILLNRKYKELLLNYWSIVAGRGSYKSLIDSLNWFEYGDLVRIEELWKHEEWSQTRFNREELNTILTEDIQATLSNFSKTTYLGIYLALEKYLQKEGVIQYDKLADFDSNEYEGLIGEMTPKLEQKFFKWSVQEMSLKMYLLGCFYESYFMPIHLDLLHSTIESLVFANTIKCINTDKLLRVDHVYNTQAFKCSVQDGDTYQLINVNVQAGESFFKHYDSDDSDDSSDDSTNMISVYDSDDSSDDYDSHEIFGIVDEYNSPLQYDGECSDDDVVNQRLKTFMVNNYNGIGVVVPFKCDIPAETGDFINYEKVVISVYKNDILYSTRELEKHQLYAERDSQFNVNFNLLFTEEGYTIVTLYFTTTGGRSYIKVLHLNIVGDTVCTIKVYKVKSCEKLSGLNADDYTEDNIYDLDSVTGLSIPYPDEFKQKHVRRFNDYMFTHVRGSSVAPEVYNTFISCTKGNRNDNGAKQNYVVIFDASFFDDPEREDDIAFVNSCILDEGTGMNLFDIGLKNVQDDEGHTVRSYYILVSKPFVGFSDDSEGLDTKIDKMVYCLRGYVVRFSKGFFFQHHYLEELGVRRLTTYVQNDEQETVISNYKYVFGDSLDDYTITDSDTVCVVPDIKYSGINLTDTEWVFTNVSTIDKEEYRYPSTKEPFISRDIKQQLKPGFYNITFRYKLGDTYEEVTLNSAFRKV